MGLPGGSYDLYTLSGVLSRGEQVHIYTKTCYQACLATIVSHTCVLTFFSA